MIHDHPGNDIALFLFPSMLPSLVRFLPETSALKTDDIIASTSRILTRVVASARLTQHLSQHEPLPS